MQCIRKSRSICNPFVAAALTAALLTPLPLRAQDYYSNLLRDLPMLPPYCQYTQYYRDRVPGGRDPEQLDYWYSYFGGSVASGTGIFHAMHHYCFGLTDINYAKYWERNEQNRRFRWEQSIAQFDYMIQSSKPGEKMLPDFHTKKGESLLAVGKAPLAMTEFEQAIALKPDYWPPYADMSDYYKRSGNIKLARAALERGLAAAPDTKALTRRLAELDSGKDNSSTAQKSSKKPTAAEPRAQQTAPKSEQQAHPPQPSAEK
jgi:tetratricopeptide (TPR) repeat protein